MEQCVDTETSKCCESDLIAEGSAMKRKLGSRDCCEKGRFVQIVPRWRKTGEEAYEETLRGTIWDWPRKLQKVKGNYWGRKPWGKKYNVKWSYKQGNYRKLKETTEAESHEERNTMWNEAINLLSYCGYLFRHQPSPRPRTRLKGRKKLSPGDNLCVQKTSPRDKTGSQKPHP